jgi:hypothetical protein
MSPPDPDLTDIRRLNLAGDTLDRLHAIHDRPDLDATGKLREASILVGGLLRRTAPEYVAVADELDAIGRGVGT